MKVATFVVNDTSYDTTITGSSDDDAAFGRTAVGFNVHGGASP